MWQVVQLRKTTAYTTYNTLKLTNHVDEKELENNQHRMSYT